MTFREVTEGIIFNDENMIGFSWDIADYIRYELEEQKNHLEPEDYEETAELFTDLLKDLDEHDGLVYVYYHPMGSYSVEDLVTKSGREVWM